jgi:hypothetical protein
MALSKRITLSKKNSKGQSLLNGSQSLAGKVAPETISRPVPATSLERMLAEGDTRLAKFSQVSDDLNKEIRQFGELLKTPEVSKMIRDGLTSVGKRIKKCYA